MAKKGTLHSATTPLRLTFPAFRYGCVCVCISVRLSTSPVCLLPLFSSFTSQLHLQTKLPPYPAAQSSSSICIYIIMLSFNTTPFTRFTEKVISAFTPTKKVEVMCRLTPGPRPFAMSHHRVYDPRAIHYYHHKHGWIPRNRSVFAKLSDFLFDDTPKRYREAPPPKVRRLRQNMSHLTPEQKKRLARAKRQSKRRATHY